MVNFRKIKPQDWTNHRDTSDYKINPWPRMQAPQKCVLAHWQGTNSRRPCGLRNPIKYGTEHWSGPEMHLNAVKYVSGARARRSYVACMHLICSVLAKVRMKNAAAPATHMDPTRAFCNVPSLSFCIKMVLHNIVLSSFKAPASNPRRRGMEPKGNDSCFCPDSRESPFVAVSCDLARSWLEHLRKLGMT